MNKRRLQMLFALGTMLIGVPSVEAQAYSSYVSGTQIHASASLWGNSSTHHLLDTVTITVPVAVSRASWSSGNAYTFQKSLINIYDAGLHCLISPGPSLGGCQPGRLYVHTGPLLSSQTNPQQNAQVSVPLVADQDTVCKSYPCILPVGTYSLTTGTSETAAHAMTLWSDGSTSMNGGAEFHIGNSFGDPANAFIAGYVQQSSTVVLANGSSQVTLNVSMLNGQSASDSNTGFSPGMRFLVAGLTSGFGGPSDPCNGYSTVSSVSAGTITYIVAGSPSCTVEGNTDGSETCNGLPSASGAPGYACVAAGLPAHLSKVIVDQKNANGQPSGYYCYVAGTAAECQRNNFVGPAGPQSGAHSVGIMIY